MSFSASAALPFQPFGTDHLAALGVAVVAAVMLLKRARQLPGNTRFQDRSLALFLLLLFPAQWLVSWKLGTLDRNNVLPCQLCDVAALCGAGALWFRHQRLAELVWFWGLAGTLNGLITPALDQAFPSPRFISFFALHGGVVVTAVYLVAGLGLRPQPGAVRRVWGWLQVYLISAGTVNLMTGANYGFLRAKPAQASPMDLMGPWPWYLLALEFLALLLFWLLALPFRRPRPLSGSGDSNP